MFLPECWRWGNYCRVFSRGLGGESHSWGGHGITSAYGSWCWADSWELPAEGKCSWIGMVHHGLASSCPGEATVFCVLLCVVPRAVMVTVTWQISYKSKKKHLLKKVMDLNRARILGAKWGAVLGLTGAELIFFTVAGMRLCFGFGWKQWWQ